jgi:hypothetical protein
MAQLRRKLPSGLMAFSKLAYAICRMTRPHVCNQINRGVRPGSANVSSAPRPPGQPDAPGSATFVSFATEDELFAMNLVDLLRSLGHSAYSSAAQTGTDKNEHDAAAVIDACDAFVLVVSPTAIRSEAWRRQLASAWKAASRTDRVRQLVPVLRAGATPETLRSALELSSAAARASTEADCVLPRIHRPIVCPESGDFAVPFRLFAQALGIETWVDVFISYSRKDSAFVETLDVHLRAAGKRTWVDRSNLKPSDDWMRAIKTGIEASDNFLFVISPDSIASRNCKEEVEYAVELKKRIIPVQRSWADEHQIPKELRARHWITFQDADQVEAPLKKVVDALDRDADYAANHTRFLMRALEWQAKRKDRNLLLRGSEVRDGTAWLELAEQGLEPEATTLHEDFIGASCRRDATLRQLRTGVAVVLLLIAVAVGAWWLWSRTDGYQVRLITADARRYLDRASGDVVGSWVGALVRSGRIDEALETAGGVKDPASRSYAFAVASEALFEMDQPKKALFSARSALVAARQASFEAKAYPGPVSMLARVAETLAESQREAEATAVAELVAAERAGNELRGQEAFARVTEELAYLGRLREAKFTASLVPDGASRREALAVIEKEDLSDKTLPFQAVALAREAAKLFKSGKVVAAIDVADRALAACAGEVSEYDRQQVELIQRYDWMYKENRSNRTLVYANVAAILAKAGMAQQSLAAADNVESWESDPYVPVAQGLALSGQWNAAMEAAKKVAGTGARARATLFVVEELAAVGRLNDAEAAAENMSVDAASVRNDSKQRSSAYRDLAIGWSRLRRLGRARRAAEQCSYDDDRIQAYIAILLRYAQDRGAKIPPSEQVGSDRDDR